MFYPKYYGDNILKEDDMPKDDDLIIDFLLKKQNMGSRQHERFYHQKQVDSVLSHYLKAVTQERTKSSKCKRVYRLNQEVDISEKSGWSQWDHGAQPL